MADESPEILRIPVFDLGDIAVLQVKTKTLRETLNILSELVPRLEACLEKADKISQRNAHILNRK